MTDPNHNYFVDGIVYGVPNTPIADSQAPHAFLGLNFQASSRTRI
jgi:hypothetical protein